MHRISTRQGVNDNPTARTKAVALAAACAAALALSGCAGVERAPATVADRLAARSDLSVLRQYVQTAGLEATLRGPGPFTVFAPSNEAFLALPAATRQRIDADPAALRALLSYHLLPTATTAAQINGGNARTVHGAPLALSRAGEFVTVEDAVVRQADLGAGNGVVHVIDRVLSPPPAPPAR